MQLDRQPATDGSPLPPADVRPADQRTWLAPGGGDGWTLPDGYSVAWAGEGEWKITLDVFRDLGLAFAAALFGIFVILMFQTGSRLLPLVIMLAIPLTMIGIMPGFWLLNVVVNRPIGGYPNPVFFTAIRFGLRQRFHGLVKDQAERMIAFDLDHQLPAAANHVGRHVQQQ